MHNKLFNENCIKTMSRMPDNFIDLVVTSPPYDELRQYKGFEFIFKVISKELYRVIKPGGVCVWIVGDATVNGSETLTSLKQAIHFQNIGFNIHDTMIYHKNNFYNKTVNKYYQNFEYMFVLSKGKPKTANLLKDRPNKTAGQKIHGTQRSVNGQLISKSGVGKQIAEFGYRGNVWSYTVGGSHTTKDKCAYGHPAIMPDGLAIDHILTWSNEGDLVYDPMAGSGTVLKWAKKLKRDYIGSEIAREYIPIIQERLRNVIVKNNFEIHK